MFPEKVDFQNLQTIFRKLFSYLVHLLFSKFYCLFWLLIYFLLPEFGDLVSHFKLK